MFKKMNKKEKITFVATIVVSLFVIYFFYLFAGRKFFNSYDTLNQHIPFYTEFRNKIYNGESLFWSHNFFFGSSFLTGKSYYLTTDIFSYIFLLFPFLEVVDALFVLQLIKNIVSYVGMYKFLDEFNFSFKSKIVGAIAYTFSGWFLLFYGMPSFASFICILPFFFMGVECYLRENNLIKIAICSVILICSNYYLFYSLSIFLVLYWIARYLLYYNEKFYIKKFIKKTALLILIYLLGVGISAPIMIPVAYEMLHNTRVVNSSISGLLWPLNTYVDMFVKFISSPVYVSKNMNTVLQSNYYRLDQIGLFTTSCLCLFIPQLFVQKNKTISKISLIYFAITILFLFTQIGCSIFHGFSEPSFRWVIFIVFVNCIVLSYYLTNKELINVKMLIATLFIYLIIGSIIIMYYKMYRFAKIQFVTISMSMVLMIIYSILIITNNKNICLLIVCEIIILGFFSNYLWKDKFQNSYSYDFIPKNYFEKMNDPNEFYRVWVSNYYVDMDYNSDFNYNSNLFLRYKGLYSYDSTSHFSMSGLVKSYEQPYHWYEMIHDGIITTASTKYYIAKGIEDIPNPNVNYIEKIGDSEYNLYLNNDYKKFGFTNNNVYSYQLWSFEDIYSKDRLLKDYLIINDNDILENNIANLEKTESHFLEKLKYTSNTIEGEITTTSQELLFLSIPYDRGWNVYCDGMKMKKIYTDCGFISVLIPSGTHHIYMKYIPFGFKLGCVISIFSLTCLVVIKRKKKNYDH